MPRGGGNNSRLRRILEGIRSDKIAAIDNAFVSVNGRMFGRWIDYADASGTTRDSANGSANDPGYNEDGLIENPAYIIESLFREEVWVERDLQITSSADSTHFVCTDVLVREDDYYNNSEITNCTTGAKSYITDYTGSTGRFVINDADASMATSDNFFLTNIQGDNKLDINSFDIVGNSTNGLRDGWIFGRSLNTNQSLETIINALCYESHCELFERADEDNAYTKIKLVALDEGTGNTWSYPAYSDGKPLIKCGLTDLSNIFTAFRLYYHYDYGKQDYVKSVYVDRNGVSSSATILGDVEQNLCKYAYQSYRIENPFEYSSNWIYDDDTAEYFLQKKINWFTKQRLKVTWVTGIADSNDEYIKYERGDQVKLNFSDMIPSGVNNSHYFMITEKNMTTIQGAPYIRWQLIDMN